MADRSSRSSEQEVEQLFKELAEESKGRGVCIDFERINDLLDLIHVTPVVDEKGKLRKKDKDLVQGIGDFQRWINQQLWMPQGTAVAFHHVCLLFTKVESILWELKGEEGPIQRYEPPKPEPDEPKPEKAKPEKPKPEKPIPTRPRP